MPDLSSRLAALFGFPSFREHQENIVRAILDGRDTFTLMPTGGGKSLCYQLPAGILPGACVVISPLLSLMKDQVDAANANGLRAAAFNSASGAAEKSLVRRQLRDGELDLLYISPERLRAGDFLNLLKSVPLSFFAVDEAHCISQWGHDFRPDYLALSMLAEEFPQTPISTFTATATSRVAEDIITRLGLRDPLLSRASFNRPNLFYQVSPKEKLEDQLLEFLAEHTGEAGIIYRTTRKDVDSTAAFLQSRGMSCLAYHAGLSDADRRLAQDAFRQDACQIIVATVAFGMGIDKPNVRFVVHGDLPKNLEGYYQETGRAGRDGEPARCVLFYGRKDVATLMRFAEGMEDPEAREAAKTQLYRMLDFTRKEGCRRKALLAYFGELFPEENCGCCDVCTGEVRREEALVSARKLLSAMVRTECRFGARHVINIVRGKVSKQVESFGHARLPTFGVGADREETYWRRVMDAILAQGLAVIPDPSFPCPAITERGWQTLKGRLPFSILRGADDVKEKRRSRRRDQEDSPLFSLLREERARLAKEAGVPPYVVFSDRSLREMALFLPDTPEKMLAVHGVGRHKLETYGRAFLPLIGQWLTDHPERASRSSLSGTGGEDHAPEKRERGPRRERESAREKGESWRETGELLARGLTIAEAAEARDLKPGTILQHMARLAEAGERFRVSQFMDPDRLNLAKKHFYACNGWKLGPVVELSKRKDSVPFSFEEAGLARILIQAGME